MKARHRWSKLLTFAFALVLAGFGANADTPLRPPEDFVHETAAATVHGSVARNRITITPHAIPGSPSWSIPVFAQFYALSPMADSILVLPYGGNLLGSLNPDQVLLTVWYAESAAIRNKSFKLAEVMDPASLPRTASHHVWLKSIDATQAGWLLALSDGRHITITYR